MIAPTTSYADWSTGNPIIDVIRAVISIKNTSEKIKNRDFSKESEKLATKVIEKQGDKYTQSQAEKKFNLHKEKVISGN